MYYRSEPGRSALTDRSADSVRRDHLVRGISRIDGSAEPPFDRLSCRCSGLSNAPMLASLTLSADLTAGAISAIRRSCGRLFSTANHNFSHENIELPVTPQTVNPLYRFYRASVDWFL